MRETVWLRRALLPVVGIVMGCSGSVPGGGPQVETSVDPAQIVAGGQTTVTCTVRNGPTEAVTSYRLEPDVGWHAEGDLLTLTRAGNFVVRCEVAELDLIDPVGAELAVAPGEPVQVVTHVDPPVVPVHQPSTVTCAVENGHGNALEGDWALSITVDDGLDLLGDQATSETPGTYEVRCQAPSNPDLNAMPAQLEVTPDVPVSVEITLKPDVPTLKQGSVGLIGWIARDIYGNETVDGPAELVVPPGPTPTDGEGHGYVFEQEGLYPFTVRLEEPHQDITDTRIIPVDGTERDDVADVKDADCTADFTLSMPDGSQTTINGCLDWSLDVAVEYNPDDPPEVRAFTLEFNGTAEAPNDCRITIKQEGVCGTGNYLIGKGGVGTTIFTTFDCSGVGDDYEGEFSGSIGYLRLDKIDAGPTPGGAVGNPLATTIEGYLTVVSKSGLSLTGDFSVSIELIAADKEEQGECATITCGVCAGSDVVDWPTFAGCEEIDGDLLIQDWTITSLPAGVQPCPLTSAGAIRFTQAMALGQGLPLTSFSLPALTSVGDDLVLDGTVALTSFLLPALTSVGGIIRLKYNAVLTSFELPALTSIGATLALWYNPALTSLSLPALTSVGGDLSVWGNFALPQCLIDALVEEIEAGEGIAGNICFCLYEGEWLCCPDATNNSNCTCSEVDGALEATCD